MNTIQKYKRGDVLYRTGIPRTSRYVWFTNNKHVAELYKERNKKPIFEFVVPTNNMKFINIRNPEFVKYIINQSKNPNNIKKGIYVNNSGRVIRNSKYDTNKKIANLIKNLKNKFGYNYNGFYNKGNNKLETEVLIFNNKVRNINRSNLLRRSSSIKNTPTRPMHNKAVSFSNWKRGVRINREANTEKRRRNAENLKRSIRRKMEEREARERAEAERARARSREALNRKKRIQNFRYKKPESSSKEDAERALKRQAYLRQLMLEESRAS